jgi:hypothetical protein
MLREHAAMTQMVDELEIKRKFLSGPGGKELLYSIGNSVSALHWGKPIEGGVHSNGSMFFLDTGNGIFGVTAKHVFEEYERSLGESHVVCQIDNLLFNPIERLVSKGIDSDIATFKITAGELKQLGRITTPWPPIIPTEGQAVLLAGFPGCEKKFTSTSSVDFGKLVQLARVDSVNSRDISFVRPSNSDLIDTLGLGLPQRQYNMGGLSGGPMAIVRDVGNILSWAVSGVVYESHDIYEITKAARADAIEADGNVKS